MFCRSITWFICNFVAVVIARSTDYNNTGIITGSYPEVTVHHLRTNNSQSSTTEGAEEVRETSATDLGTLLDAGDGAVVMLLAGDTRLAVHKAVLTARSSVFKATIHHNSLQAGSGVVIVPDVEGPVLRQLLAYLYTLQAPQLPDMAMDLLVAADRYGVSDLKAACEQQVAHQLSVENAAAVAVLALRHSCSSLRPTAIAFIKAHTHQVVMTQGWADATVGDPHSVVELTRLIAEAPEETSTTATAEISAPHQPETAVSAAPPTTLCHTPPPDEKNVSNLRRRSGKERGNMLIEAAKDGAVETLQALLVAGADVGATDENQGTALHWAADRGQLQVTGCLLEAGAEVDARNSRDSTPLLWAADTGHAAIVRLLVSACADPNAKNEFGKTPLHYAVDKGHTEAAAALIESGANVWARDNGGDTPRHLARQRNNQQLVDLLARSLHRCKHLE